MRWLIVFVVVMLLLPGALAATTPVQNAAASNAAAQDTTRFISAEVVKQLQDMKTALSEEMKANQDENFRLLDERISQFEKDARDRIVIAGIGSMLLANALIGLFMMYIYRRYSYETYQDTVIKAQKKEITSLKEQSDALAQLQTPSWNQQQPQQTIGMKMGQELAGDMSMMNQWQGQPAYAGSWTPPPENVQPFQVPPQQYQQQPQNTQNEVQDPMARPWTMQNQGW